MYAKVSDPSFRGGNYNFFYLSSGQVPKNFTSPKSFQLVHSLNKLLYGAKICSEQDMLNQKKETHKKQKKVFPWRGPIVWWVRPGLIRPVQGTTFLFFTECLCFYLCLYLSLSPFFFSIEPEFLNVGPVHYTQDKMVRKHEK